MMTWRARFMMVVGLVVLLAGLMPLAAQDMPPLTETGEYGVGIRILTLTDPSRDDRELETFIWYPALVSADAPRPYPVDLSGAPYPLIIYSHGFTGSPSDQHVLISHLVSQGYVVAGVTHHDNRNEVWPALVDRPLDVTFLLDQLGDEDNLPDEALVGLMDTEQVGMFGYSFGGYTTLVMGGARADGGHLSTWCNAEPGHLQEIVCIFAPVWDEIQAYRDQLIPTSDEPLWSSQTDERITAILGLAPCFGPLFGEDGLAEIALPTFILVGDLDTDCPLEIDAQYMYDNLNTADHYLVTLEGRNHGSFLFGDVVPHYLSAFFGYYMQGQSDYAAYLSPDTAVVFRDTTLQATLAEAES